MLKIETLFETDSIERKIRQTIRGDNRGYQSFLADPSNRSIFLYIRVHLVILRF